MIESEVMSSRRGPALIVTLNRPERQNAMTLDLANQLFTILKNATTDRSVRAVLIHGAGGSFMDGLDPAFFLRDLDMALEQANQLVQPYHSIIRELQSMDKPVLAAVSGHVTGAGMSLMLGSDLVIAAKSTTFCCNFANMALSSTGGCSFFLPRKIGASRAVEMLLLNQDFDAVYAEKLHLINRVVPDDRLEGEALAWVDQLAEGPTKALGSLKKLVLAAFENDLDRHLSLEHTHFGHNTRSFDFREAVKALKTNRPAKFTGV
jgi:2-(1,2-epoxy-1,2-dihydrophenyl)acetyl-CoA isomerase